MSTQEQIKAIKTTTLQQLVQFHQEFYGASNATIAVVGDMDEAAVKSAINQAFGTWKSPSHFKRIASPYIANKVENLNLNTPNKANAMFYAGMNLPMNDEHPDYAALLIGNYMLGGGFLNSRLATRIRQNEGLSYGVGSFFYAGTLDKAATFGAYAIYAPENAAKLEAAFREEIEKVQKEGFTQEELQAAVSGWLQAQQVTRSQDKSLARKLNRNLYVDRSILAEATFEEKIQNLKLAAVNGAMKKHLDLDKMVFIKAGDWEGANKRINEVRP
ncbi:MAG: insulinase family protein [Bacteroidota bacterium]